MRYSNPKIPEGINTSKEHPLKEFIILTTGALAALFLLAVLLSYFGATLARFIPFEMEQGWTEGFFHDSVEPTELKQYLESVSNRVAKSMGLEDEYQIHLHYSTDKTINAFATLGGNIILFKGLLELLPNEDALAMLIAHEMTHIQHRDPIVSFASSLSVQTGLAILLGNSDVSVLGDTGLLTMLHFSRKMEAAADAQAVAVVDDLYGHIAGATDLFNLLSEIRKKQGMGEQMAIFSSHPLDKKRLEAME
ncbi:MAG: M48 family metallopeptidase, partial [Gammaproteobacteria bacterium]